MPKIQLRPILEPRNLTPVSFKDRMRVAESIEKADALFQEAHGLAVSGAMSNKTFRGVHRIHQAKVASLTKKA